MYPLIGEKVKAAAALARALLESGVFGVGAEGEIGGNTSTRKNCRSDEQRNDFATIHNCGLAVGSPLF
jgi:hypothetical protein